MAKIQTKVYVDGNEAKCPYCGCEMVNLIDDSTIVDTSICQCDACTKYFSVDFNGSYPL